MKKDSKKHMRLPNGFGQITELKNQSLRKPFRVMVTVGKNEYGRPICKLLKPVSYFKTYNDAYKALVEYNKDPYELDSDLTFKDLYNEWSKKYFEKMKSDSSVRTLSYSWKYCSDLYNYRVRDIRVRHLKECINNSKISINGVDKKSSANTKTRIKSLFNLLFDYAVEYELSDKNYARMFSLSDEIIIEKNEKTKGHVPFSDSEMQIIWNNENINYVDMILVQCYSGWRPQELCNLEIKNIDLINKTFSGGMKTSAGKNRLVPIHPKIYNIVLKNYKYGKDNGNRYLFCCKEKTKMNEHITYSQYRDRFISIMAMLNIKDHRPHDCRAYFITLCKKYNVDEYAIKYMVGHEIYDITEKIYTKRNIKWLTEEIEKIK